MIGQVTAEFAVLAVVMKLNGMLVLVTPRGQARERSDSDAAQGDDIANDVDDRQVRGEEIARGLSDLSGEYHRYAVVDNRAVESRRNLRAGLTGGRAVGRVGVKRSASRCRADRAADARGSRAPNAGLIDAVDDELGGVGGSRDKISAAEARRRIELDGTGAIRGLGFGQRDLEGTVGVDQNGIDSRDGGRADNGGGRGGNIGAARDSVSGNRHARSYLTLFATVIVKLPIVVPEIVVILPVVVPVTFSPRPTLVNELIPKTVWLAVTFGGHASGAVAPVQVYALGLAWPAVLPPEARTWLITKPVLELTVIWLDPGVTRVAVTDTTGWVRVNVALAGKVVPRESRAQSDHISGDRYDRRLGAA